MENSSLPGAWPAPPPTQPPPYTPIPPIRNGVFPHIVSFMVIPDRSPPYEISYRIASVADLRPGRIIYIRDQQSRLDGRVMLVLSKSTAGFTCIPFCLHWIPASSVDHWQVRAAVPAEVTNNHNNNASQRRGGCLKIVLRPFADAPQLHPQQNITINIGDIWNVENVVNVAVLGFVKHRHLVDIMEAVKGHFCDSMDQALRELEVASRGPAVVGTGSRRRRFS